MPTLVPALAALLLAAVAAALAAWTALEGRRRLARLERSVQVLLDEAVASRSRVAAALGELERLGADTERVRSLAAATGARLASERARADRVVEILAALPPADVVVAEHYLPPAERSG